MSCFSQEKNQSVIAAAGDISKNATMILEWTVGEPIIETATSTTTLYTQGFHQPVLKVQKSKSSSDLVTNTLGVHVFPNPTTAILNVQLDKATNTPLLVSLTDVNGKVLLKNNFPVNSTALKINVSNLSQGTYLLHIADAKGVFHSEYKVIKAQ
jgi:hypothetical protein